MNDFKTFNINSKIKSFFAVLADVFEAVMWAESLIEIDEK